MSMESCTFFRNLANVGIGRCVQIQECDERRDLGGDTDLWNGSLKFRRSKMSVETFPEACRGRKVLAVVGKRNPQGHAGTQSIAANYARPRDMIGASEAISLCLNMA